MTEEGVVWSERDATPAQIEAALRELLRGRRAQGEAYAPARVVNLIVIADRQWRGEILNRLERVGRYHASRTILCAVEDGREQIDAWASVEAEAEEIAAGRVAVAREEVVLDIGPRHLEHLDRIVDPLVVTDLPTVVWSPHGHREAVDAVLRLCQVALVDSVAEPAARAAVERATALRERVHVVDLAWLRSTPWRERLAASFDPPAWRGELERLSSVEVRHRSDSEVVAVLLLGWLARRLGWEAAPLRARDGGWSGTARAPDGDVALALASDRTMAAPGLAGLTVESRAGLRLSLDRSPGGLAARRRTPDGHETAWTILGASRGEGGILGEGIRQALLRDRGYEAALAAAEEMICP